MLTQQLPIIIIMSLSILFFGFRRLRGKINNLQLFYIILFCFYIANLIGVTFFPFPHQKYLIQTMIKEHLAEKNNIIPFKTIISTLSMGSLSISLKQIGGNILLFVPMGFIIPLLFKLKNINKTIIIGFIISCLIEILQFVCSYFIGYAYRSSDIDDVITNTLGTIIGLLVFKYLYKFLKQNNLLVLK